MTIKELRTKYNMTQAQFSEVTGIPVRSIQNWEGGQRNCPPYLIPMIEAYLEKVLK